MSWDTVLAGLKFWRNAFDDGPIADGRSAAGRRARVITAIALGVLSFFAICLIAVGAGPAYSETKSLSGYNRICIIVINLIKDHDFKFRDDLSERISTDLNRNSGRIVRPVTVLPRKQCLKPNEYQVSGQISLELSVKRQMVMIDGTSYHVAIIGGSSSNVMGVLSAYELQPILIIQKSAVTDDQVESAFVTWVDTRVFNYFR